MKRVLSAILMLIMLLSLTGCKDNKNDAQAFEELVSKIDTISLDSEESIIAAEDAYKELSEEQKSEVSESNDKLIKLRKDYDDLVQRINSVTTLINVIGDDVLKAEKDIIAAEEAFNKLSDEEKAMIPEDAQKLSRFREKLNTALIEKVIDAIDSIGTVTIKSKESVETARNLYDSLNAEKKIDVTNYEKLTSAEAELEKLVKAEKKKTIDKYSSKFDKDTDPIEGITWYMHNNMPDYIDTRSYIIPYIGVSGNNHWICIRYNYTADDWIFWKKLTIMIDGEKYYKSFSYYDISRDNDTEVWENYDECLNYNQSMDSEQIEMLSKIANSNETIIRFEGDEYYYDLYVKNSDKQIIKDVLILYEAMVG